MHPYFKAAACHVAPHFLDSAKTADKAVDLISEAAANGASLIAFPESFLPGFPVWAGVQAPILSHDLFKKLASQAVTLDSPEVSNICAAARKHSVYVSLGITEGTSTSLGCIWNSNVLIGSDGVILNHHRKLVPTYFEKLIWANGDGRGLRVVETEIGRLGMLICGENTNPLARYSLIAQGEHVHISSYPPAWPTHPAGENSKYDLRRAIEIRAASHAFEAKVFNIVASGCFDASMQDALKHLDQASIEALEVAPRGISMIVDPTGEVISNVIQDSEGIVYADIEIERCVEPKQFHDVVGYYNRFDIFQLNIDQTAREPAIFVTDIVVDPGRSPRKEDLPTPSTNGSKTDLS